MFGRVVLIVLVATFLGWSLLTRTVDGAGRVGSTLVLARLLTPRDFAVALAGFLLGSALLVCLVVASAFLGALLTARERWRRVGIVMHLANGAFFGATFARMGRGGWRQGLIAAELENLVLWPTMAVFDRIHSDRRRGSWRR